MAYSYIIDPNTNCVFVTHTGKFKVDEETIMKYISKHIDLTLRPKKILFIDKFPKSVNGKIKKNLLKININQSIMK